MSYCVPREPKKNLATMQKNNTAGAFAGSNIKSVYNSSEKTHLRATVQSVTCHTEAHNVTCHPTQVNVPHINPSQTEEEEDFA